MPGNGVGWPPGITGVRVSFHEPPSTQTALPSRSSSRVWSNRNALRSPDRRVSGPANPRPSSTSFRVWASEFGPLRTFRSGSSDCRVQLTLFSRVVKFQSVLPSQTWSIRSEASPVPRRLRSM